MSTANHRTAALLYNFWRHITFLVKAGMDCEARTLPVATVETFVQTVGQSLGETN